jgi:hypothetical protein
MAQRGDQTDEPATYCVIGAGSSGLAAVKNLRQYGFDVECFERAEDVGGNWNYGGPTSRVYASTHTISSKPFTQYPDFPMPDHWPDYPHHSQLHAYFRRYAEHFGLLRHVRFGHEVVALRPVDGGAAWEATVRVVGGTEETRRYAGVVVANGHNWKPKWPSYTGEFAGELLHSMHYKGPDVLRGKRVLVVGGGNTGCDVAVEAAQHADHALHSTRRGYWYVPKFVFGRPGDQVNDLMIGLRLPRRLRQWLFRATLRATVGDLTRFGLPAPDHDILETHPIVNSLLVYHVGHGDITPKPDIRRFDGYRATFADGSEEEVDMVLCCTGYLATVDFMDDPARLNWDGDRFHLYQHVFTPRYDNLFVAGLIQPDSGQFTIAHWQTVAVAEFLRARRRDPATARAFLDAAGHDLDHRYTAGVNYAESTRHYYEIAHHDYVRGLEQSINRLRGAA